jgi:uncharacterized protein YukE
MGDKGIGSLEYIPANQCFAEKPTTKFGLECNMDQMKAMVQSADVGTVKSVAQGWADLSNDLIGSGGIKESLETAVQHVLAHWEGRSADLFRERAQKISKTLTDSAGYADNVAASLQGAAAVLSSVRDRVLAMEKPGKLASAGDYLSDFGDRDGGPAADDALKNGASSGDVLANKEGSLSAGREAQLKMAEQMEILGAAYNSRAKEMGKWTGQIQDEKDYPGDPSGGVAPAPVIVPTGTATRSPQKASTGTAGRGGQTGTIGSSKPVAPPAGISGGAHKATPQTPNVGTAIDGISGGRTNTPTVGGGGLVGGGSTSGSGLGGGAGFVGGAVGGAAGAGAARSGMVGRAGGAGMAGRAGAGGVGGAGTAKGATGRVGGMTRGGVVGGTPKSGTGAGRGTAGGSGLHSSRGAAGKGASAVRKGGIAGAPGSRTGRRKEDEQREGERPDYLVEDEETWTPESNAAPRVIE